jgi:primosomal protein N' (replication factor Y)
VFADVILPLALPKRSYTYKVPVQFQGALHPGMRVEVPFGKQKRYSGLVEQIHNTDPDYPAREILDILDEMPMVSREQLQLWEWMSAYYCCTMGEVMSAALPGNLKLSSETKLIFNEEFGDDFRTLDPEEYLLAEALSIQGELSIEDSRQILNKQKVLPVIQRLLQMDVLSLKEELQEKYKQKKVSLVRLTEPFRIESDLLTQVLDEVEKYPKQSAILYAFLEIAEENQLVRKKELLHRAGASVSSLNSLIKKGVFELDEQNLSRLDLQKLEAEAAPPLSSEQTRAVSELKQLFTKQDVVLLHGVTGSGKTRVYTELIHETIASGGQVLYLLPEIALTTHLIGRLQTVLGNDVVVYHSKINFNERVDVWKSALGGKPVILAARSGLFLPFSNLKLIVIDEEHDPSFKQFNPAPRYHARDAAIYLARLHGAKVVLGTATPALETYANAHSGKYGLVELPERYGGVQLPSIRTIALKKLFSEKKMQGLFSPELLEALQTAIDQGEQAILFQNRRGYSPILECQSCGWSARCKHCDVSLTYHKYTNRLRCHYCGYQEDTPSVCPDCNSGKVSLLGFGTEKIEDELKLVLPDAQLGRLDYDTAGSKSGLNSILQAFEDREIDILIGTQMVTKGLDFENVALVGVLRADMLFKYPDFRSHERSFQLLTQVAGRAGRKHKQGQVLIQSLDPDHPVLGDVFQSDYQNFVKRELAERQAFSYPPFVRLIQITLEHKDNNMVLSAASEMGRLLREQMGNRVLGPVTPTIARLRGLYGQSILIKLEKSSRVLERAKLHVLDAKALLINRKGWRQLKITIDVDPM